MSGKKKEPAGKVPADKAAPAGKEVKKRTKVSIHQKTLLIDFMKQHNIFAKSGVVPGPFGKAGGEKLWDRLVILLNNNGSCRTKKDWKQSWADMKSKVKHKAGLLNQSIWRKTGNEEPVDENGKPIPPLTPEEEIIYDLCGATDWTGQPEDEEIGLSTTRALLTRPRAMAALELSPSSSSDTTPQEMTVEPDMRDFNLNDLDIVCGDDSILKGYKPVSKEGDYRRTSLDKQNSHKVQESPEVQESSENSAEQNDQGGDKEATTSQPHKGNEAQNSKRAANDGKDEPPKKKVKTMRDQYAECTEHYISATNNLTSTIEAHTTAATSTTASLADAISQLAESNRLQAEAIYSHSHSTTSLSSSVSALAEGVAKIANNFPETFSKIAATFGACFGIGTQQRDDE